MIRRLLTAWACRWLNLTPVVPPQNTVSPDWDDLWRYKDLRVVWPRLVLSPVWRDDLEPWLKQGLLRTLVALGQERNPEEIRILQVRAQLINQWLEEPRIAMNRDAMALDSAFASGRSDRLDAELERVNRRGR